MKKEYLISGAITSLVVVGMYFLAHQFSLYYIVWWYDWAQHFLGGIALGYFGLFFFKQQKNIILFSGGMAAVWELFERIGSMVVPAWMGFGGPFDTGVDILMALIGAWIIILIARKKIS